MNCEHNIKSMAKKLIIFEQYLTSLKLQSVTVLSGHLFPKPMLPLTDTFQHGDTRSYTPSWSTEVLYFR